LSQSSPDTALEERSWLEQARNGDREAFGRIVEAYRERVFLAALAILRNHEDARDMSQDAFIRAFKNLHRFDSARPFYPWLHRILRNLCLDHQQKYGPHRQVSLEAITEDTHGYIESHALSAQGDQGDVRDSIQRRQLAGILRHAIDELKPEFREIIIMKHLEEMPYKDIAESLDIPMGTVMSRLFHARKALRQKLEGRIDA
jgi:RNA polymerase sigma-70 factor (ECF subfamily)